ncbi:MAG: heme ABC exporter ATP-binding protein CcmA [Rhodothermales bacterium]
MTPQSQPPTLDATELAKRFGRRLLFRDLTFSLRGGESLAVTGANGSGKSTLLRILAGVMTPTRGGVTLRLNGETVKPQEHPHHVGLVAPYLNVYEGFSPRENLRFIARARRLAGEGERIARVLERVELTDRADDLVSTFSSGMRQRVKFAAAVLVEPPVLLLDEPNVNLDAAGLAMVRGIVGDHLGAGGLLVVATNDEVEADRHERALRIEDFR